MIGKVTKCIIISLALSDCKILSTNHYIYITDPASLTANISVNMSHNIVQGITEKLNQ